MIIPAYNESENLEECVRGVQNAMKGLSYEIIIVDDGSNDGTAEVARKLSMTYDNVVCLKHPTTLGKTQAIRSGFAKSSGDIIVLLDADLQYEPKDILKLINVMDEHGFDVVNGLRVNRADPFSKRFASRIFNFFANFVFGLSFRDFNSGLKAFRRNVLEQIPLRADYHRYLLGIAQRGGYKVTEVPVNHYPRIHGRSKYSFKRLFLGGADLLSLQLELSLSRRPMLMFGSLSALFFLVGLAVGLYALFTGGISVRPAVLLSISLILASVQFLATGFIADLVLQVREALKSSD